MSPTTASIDRRGLQQIIDLLRAAGHTDVGPVARDGAIVYDTLESVADLPEAGATTRVRGTTGCAGATTGRCSGTRWDPIPGSASSTRPG